MTIPGGSGTDARAQDTPTSPPRVGAARDLPDILPTGPMLAGAAALYRRSLRDEPWEYLSPPRQAMWARDFEAGLDAYHRAIEDLVQQMAAHRAQVMADQQERLRDAPTLVGEEYDDDAG
jgi:hypothetical protein